ncbi:anti-sigma factor family protein [Kitasatospora sp. NPDC059571]|uniref:anti-sigma factor family protein n=1 Tax=Kitasatospora sp. NPDC059571 TaxID=3346871 RepID=UPI0036AD7A62
MTPHTPSPAEPSGHPDVEVLADLAEDLVDPADVPALRAHLTDCPECADTFAALAEVRELLGSFEAPPMPEDVAHRLDAALATAADTPAVRAAAVGPSTAPAPPDAPRRPPGRADATGPGRAPGRRRRRALFAAIGAAVALGLGALFLPLSPDHPAGTSTAASAAHSGAKAGAVQYQDELLAAQARALVRAAGRAGTEQPDSLAHQQPAAQPRTNPAESVPSATTSAPACAAGTTGVTDRSPLAVGPGSYRGSPALALVYPVAGHPDQLDVYLITPDCSAPGVLLHRTVPAS